MHELTGLRRAVEQWGTVISVDVRDDIDPHAVDECFDWFRRVDDLFSTWRPDTEIMRFGRGELDRTAVSAEVGEILELCAALRLESRGAFDIGVGARPGLPAQPGRAPVDPSGIVKGWAVERAGAMLRAAGATCFFVNAGGDLVAAGAPCESPRGWRVGIQHPSERDLLAAVLVVTDRAVATSGTYERGDHIIDPRTGRPVEECVSMTVVGPDLAIADAYATAAMVLGVADGMDWLAHRPGYEGLAVTDDHRVVTTAGFDRYRVS